MGGLRGGRGGGGISCIPRRLADQRGASQEGPPSSVFCRRLGDTLAAPPPAPGQRARQHSGPHPFWRQQPWGRATGSMARAKHGPRMRAPAVSGRWATHSRDASTNARASAWPPTLTPRGTYRLRTWSGSEPAGEASGSTRAGAVRAGIAQVAADRTARNETPAFSRARKPTGRGRRKRKQRVPPGEGVGRSRAPCEAGAHAHPGAPHTSWLQWARPGCGWRRQPLLLPEGWLRS